MLPFFYFRNFNIIMALRYILLHYLISTHINFGFVFLEQSIEPESRQTVFPSSVPRRRCQLPFYYAQVFHAPRIRANGVTRKRAPRACRA